MRSEEFHARLAIQATPPVLAEGFQHLVAGAASRWPPDGKHRSLHESGQQIEHVLAGTHRLGGSEIELAGEHGERFEHPLLVLVEQVVGPADRVSERSVSRIDPAPDASQEPKAFIESAGDLGHIQSARPRRSELDRQWDAVEAPADLENCRRGQRIEREARVCGPSPFAEQRDRGTGRQLVDRTGVEVCHRERLDDPDVFAVHGERFATRRDDRDVRGGTQNAIDQRRNGFDDVLAVVDHDQRPPGTKHIHDGVVDRDALAGVHIQRSRKRTDRSVLIDDARQLDDVHTVGILLGDRAGEFERHRRLADPSGPDERDESVFGLRSDEPGQQLLSPDQPLHGGWQFLPTVSAVEPGLRSVRHVHGGDEFVSLAVHGSDHPLADTVVAHHSSGRLDPRRQRRLTHESVAPHVIEQFLFANHVPATLDEKRQEIEDCGSIRTSTPSRRSTTRATSNSQSSKTRITGTPPARR